MSDISPMRDALDARTVVLGDVTPARSRHGGRRSSVLLTEDLVAVGTADGAVRAFDPESLEPRWSVRRDELGESQRERDGGSSRERGGDDERGGDGGASNRAAGGAIVALASLDGTLVVGERGPRGLVSALDARTGALRWRYETAADVGEASGGGRFGLPFVADARSADGRAFVAARRYDRSGGDRSFRSVVYAFEPDGTVAWRYENDASPVSLDVGDGRVAVAYNRCPGEHADGLVVLDADAGDVRARWDPPGDGERRVGDASLFDGGVAVASHADYRGYALDTDRLEAARGRAGGPVDDPVQATDGEGTRSTDEDSIRWSVPLGIETPTDGETLYAYPNHVRAAGGRIAFLTGNTYSTAGRETDRRHPDEHALSGYDHDGERRWSVSVGGFATELAADGDRLAVPCAQHFRSRDPEVHGLRLATLEDGAGEAVSTDGVVTAAALADGRVAAVEEPVVYHDEGVERGAYRLLVATVD
ncbi:outer membrane protein assembly factor BamB family protein [Halegenticoccus tardaugens]|uniref:outer membrane protein assembly factor BamB family protein n=1 Tax=Halegenticoccus tardaugens TaxID=2071624 RepID=UPI001E5600FC|nr:PQQ-binding-like beta-propeller repeat protein [Halegenticoccus tardaugens]